MTASIVLGCGLNFFHQSNPENKAYVCTETPTLIKINSGHKDVRDEQPQALACGGNISLVLTHSGKVFQWGYDGANVIPSPLLVNFRTPFRCVMVAAGRKHCIALMERGLVLSWGVGYFGQLGVGDDIPYSEPRPIERLSPTNLGDVVVHIACGVHHSSALTENGQLFCWGLNRSGQCGIGKATNTVNTPSPVPLGTVHSEGGFVKSVVLGWHHTAIVTENGQVFTWGSATYGSLGIITRERLILVPHLVQTFASKPVQKLASGDFHMLALTMDWHVFSWGFGTEGQCGHGQTLHLRLPKKIEQLRQMYITDIGCGASFSFVLTVDGHVYTWGYNDGGWLGIARPVSLPFIEPGHHESTNSHSCSFDSKHNVLQPEMVVSLLPFRVSKVVAGTGHVLFLASLHDDHSQFLHPRPTGGLIEIKNDDDDDEDVEHELKINNPVPTFPNKIDKSSIDRKSNKNMLPPERSNQQTDNPALKYPHEKIESVESISSSGSESGSEDETDNSDDNSQGEDDDSEGSDKGSSDGGQRSSKSPKSPQSPNQKLYSDDENDKMEINIQMAINRSSQVEKNLAEIKARDEFEMLDDEKTQEHLKENQIFLVTPPMTNVHPRTESKKKRAVKKQIMPKEEQKKFFEACRSNRMEEIRKVIKDGFSIDIRDDYGNTPLIIVAQNNLKPLCELFLSNGADINAVNGDGNTACHFCFSYDFEELGKWLIANGASDQIQNAEGLICYAGLTKEEPNWF